MLCIPAQIFKVSTHSRPKAAARITLLPRAPNLRFQHTAARRRLPGLGAALVQLVAFQHTAARRRLLCGQWWDRTAQGFNTQPPEGGCGQRQQHPSHHQSFNTQPPEGGCIRSSRITAAASCFNTQPPEGGCRCFSRRKRLCVVSTHSRPKAAAYTSCFKLGCITCFNTQPPEGGCTEAA